MKTKYDWSGVPKEVKWIATDADGEVCGFKDKPHVYDGYMWAGFKPEYLNLRHATCYWKDSLEERPK